jgi:hypothetical protein
MTKVAIVARVVAKPGKEEEVAAFLTSALPLAEAERRASSGSSTPSRTRPGARLI